MKFLSKEGLQYFLGKLKNWCNDTFINKEDTEEVDTIEIDTTPTAGSNNLITSGGVEEYVDNAIATNEQVFIATYGETTYNEISNAYNAGKSVICNYDSKQYQLYTVTGTYCVFATDYVSTDTDKQFRVSVTGSSWSALSFDRRQVLQKISERQTEIPDDADDAHYPTSKAVADYVSSHGSGGTSNHQNLTNRDAANQHPISAITDLQGNLDNINTALNNLNNNNTDPVSINVQNPQVTEFINYVSEHPYPATYDLVDGVDTYDHSYVSKESDNLGGELSTLFSNKPYPLEYPMPYKVKWKHSSEAVMTYLVYGETSALEQNTGWFREVDVSNLDQYCIYNLIPGKTYYYKVVGFKADRTQINIKPTSSFTTTIDRVRMLKIDGIYNARDLGGTPSTIISSTGKEQMVKYGLLFRGSTGDESAANTGLPRSTVVTGEGLVELFDTVGIKAEVDLRGNGSSSFMGNKVKYMNENLGSYASVITVPDERARVKNLLEQIVTWITVTKPFPAYIHCQGGMDRTGTLVTIILGLLGVNESNLAIEYELSSFSYLGKRTRKRNLNNTPGYNYKGLIEEIKRYGEPGDTITECFYKYVTNSTDDASHPGCGVAEAVVTNLRNAMLTIKPDPPVPPTPSENLFNLNRNMVIGTGSSTNPIYIKDNLDSSKVLNCWYVSGKDNDWDIKSPSGRLTSDTKINVDQGTVTVANKPGIGSSDLAFPIEIDANTTYKITYSSSGDKRVAYVFFN